MATIVKSINLRQLENNNGQYPAIGDNVYIGSIVSIVGGVRIGNNVKIGAGTVVINDVPDNATTVGNPNRIIIKELNDYIIKFYR